MQELVLNYTKDPPKLKGLAESESDLLGCVDAVIRSSKGTRPGAHLQLRLDYFCYFDDKGARAWPRRGSWQRMYLTQPAMDILCRFPIPPLDLVSREDSWNPTTEQLKRRRELFWFVDGRLTVGEAFKDVQGWVEDNQE